LIVPGKLLILELWGMGDLAIATPFLRGAVQRYDTVCLLAKPTGAAMQPWLWPGVTVKTFVAPWTAFRGKYRLWKWPWGEMLRLRAAMRDQGFEIGCSETPGRLPRQGQRSAFDRTVAGASAVGAPNRELEAAGGTIGN
jgi:hypothetical protein